MVERGADRAGEFGGARVAEPSLEEMHDGPEGEIEFDEMEEAAVSRPAADPAQFEEAAKPVDTPANLSRLHRAPLASTLMEVVGHPDIGLASFDLSVDGLDAVADVYHIINAGKGATPQETFRALSTLCRSRSTWPFCASSSTPP